MSTIMLQRRWRLTFAGSVAALLLAVGGSLASRGEARSGAQSVKPTIVLVHGAWADGSSWDGVTRRLQHRGYTVVVPAVPLRSLSGDASYIASVLQSIKGPIVLVGHSYGGAVITNAAAGNANVKGLVYVDAFVPDVGESVLALAARNPGSGLPAAITEVPYQQGAQGSGLDVYIKTADFRAVFAGDVPAGQAAIMAATQRPVTLAALSEKSAAAAWKTVPSWYLIGRRDDAIPPATQEYMAHRAHSRTVSVDASHASLVSHPGAVTKLVLAAVHAAADRRRAG
jgi:pimeloyl-ACP methyl ester carboxylesterase